MSIQRVLMGKEENHILPFFWQHGEDEKTLRKYVHVIHDAHIGAFCVESRPHPDFCGPKWWADMDAILDEAKKLGMKVWILDDAHFPTGFANGAVADADPSLCRQSLVIRQFDVPEEGLKLSLNELRQAPDLVPNQIEQFMLASQPAPRAFDDDQLIAAVALKKNGSGQDLIDLSQGIDTAETLDFSAPSEGEWKICLLYLTRNRGPHRNYINMMDQASCRKLIEAVYEPHWEHYQQEFGKTIAGFFSDEPEIGNGHLYEFGKKIGELDDQAWSRAVGERLQEKWGENYRRYLPLIWNQSFDPDLEAKVRCDYMDTVTRLVEECFSFQVGDWCRDHGVMYIGHLIEDDHQHTRTGSSLGHYFRGLAGQDMAGVDDIGGQIYPQGEHIGPGDFLHPIRDGEFWHYTLGKLGSSMAAIDPLKQGRAMCEIFGNYGWSEGVRLEKYLADHLMVRGINYYVPHAFTAKDFPDPDCPPHFYAHGHNPQYRHFGALMQYMNRICTLISGGQAEIPAAILYNAEADWAGDFMYLQKPAIELYDHQIDYHFIPADVFAEDKYHTETGRTLRVGEQEYQALIIPGSEYIPAAALKAALQMKKAGGCVIFAGNLPKGTVENGTRDPLIEEVLAAFKPTALEDLVSRLDELGIRDARIEPASDRIRIYHYYDFENFYYLFNEAAEAWSGEVILPVNRAVSIYDAWSNQIIKVVEGADSLTADGLCRRVPVTLGPSQSLILLDGDDFSLRLGDPALSGQGYPENASCQDWSEGWERSFVKSIQYPRFGEKKTLSLPDTLAEEEPGFSGFVRYEKNLQVEGRIQHTVLEISDAYEGVEVFVNGMSLGIQIIPVFRFDLTPCLRAGKNEIRIEVATTLEREAVSFPSRWAAAGMPKPEVTVPSGINGTVRLITY